MSNHKGGEWHSPCPVCGGDDRFHTWPTQDGGAVAREAGVPGTWWCRSCDKTGDVIGLLMFADGLEFRAACKELRIELAESGRRLQRLTTPRQAGGQSAAWTPATWEMPAEPWRTQATKLALKAHEQLLNLPQYLAYLAGRGLPLEAVQRYRLGYLEGEDRRTGTCLYRARSAFGLPDKVNADASKTRQVLWIPRGLTIPLWHEDEVTRLRIRRPKTDVQEGDAKYMLLTGSCQAPLLLPPLDVPPALAVWVVVEAELDAMAVHHACDGKVGVLAALTNRGKPDAAAHKLLAASPLILVALDFDPPGKKGERPGHQGWLWWRRHYAQARRWPVPVGKDPGEAHRAGVDLGVWVRAGLPAALVLPAGSVGTAPSGSCAKGAGGDQPPYQHPPKHPPKHPSKPPRKPLRWQGAGAATPLAAASLPEGCGYTVPYLREVYAEKTFSDALLVACPKTRPAWWWTYYRTCRTCEGHRHCVVDFLTSPQMLAPLMENCDA